MSSPTVLGKRTTAFTLDEQLTLKQSSRKKTVAKVETVSAAGWVVIEPGASQFAHDPTESPFLRLDLPRGASVAYVFLRLFPIDYAMTLVTRRREEHDGAFCYRPGKPMVITPVKIQQFLAAVIRIQVTFILSRCLESGTAA